MASDDDVEPVYLRTMPAAQARIATLERDLAKRTRERDALLVLSDADVQDPCEWCAKPMPSPFDIAMCGPRLCDTSLGRDVKRYCEYTRRWATDARTRASKRAW